MIKVVAKKLVNEGKVEEVIKLYEELVRETRKEEGCIKYELYQDEKDPRVLAVIEEWESKDVLERHMNSEHFTRIVPMIGELAEKKKDMNIYNKLI
ncbi:putative quinol monooxygenase [Clostridium sp. OS1-26]|uniref:putative quinol monooxygenase n=1 Tax=Clostridium sp. OS1-26 TaxID=3070681 RepID=UPI0027DFC185|nr:putative quinol monooxygenase [Clostridium sp. OS1-26]WML37445.1 putative quinol monooxygenase [Clostridium sp. OS1-26]